MTEPGLFGVFRGILRALLALLGGIAGYQLARFLMQQDFWPWSGVPAMLAVTGATIVLVAGIGFLCAPLFLKALLGIGSLTERHLQIVSWADISVSIIGLIIGLLVANLIALPFADFPVIGMYIAVLLNLTLGYIGVRVFWKRRDDILSMLGSMSELKGRFRFSVGKRGKEGKPSPEGAPKEVMKILDTSVVIDGRLLDIAKTGFLEGTLVLPRFVLIELQGVADSSDPVRRSRGRRGLDVVNELQEIDDQLDVLIVETTLRELGVDTVDEGLVALAKQMDDSKILTTDYNLNKISQIQGISVLNVNDLANALKPMLLPGENVVVDIIREGKEAKQGVGYLDDGTMIVVEEGQKLIGRRVEVMVTSMLQTSAGRMIFGRIKRETSS